MSNGVEFNFSKICQDLLNDLSQRQREVILRRFALPTIQRGDKGRRTNVQRPERETLESIGKSYGITRERVRQIEKDGLLKLKPKLAKYQPVFHSFIDQLRREGDLKREDILLKLLGGSALQNEAFFLLTLADPFKRFSETEDYHPLWTIDQNSFNFAQKVVTSFYNLLFKIKQPLAIDKLSINQVFGKDIEKQSLNRLSYQALQSFLEISKKIQQNPDGLFGLEDWPEINPRGIKDKAYLVFKKAARPLHFTEVANLIGEKNINCQSVHNELIRDPRFVLVGRGLYALAEWGYVSGAVKDIIFKILREAKEPLSKKEIVVKVLKQRFVKENTISLNLSDKKCFLRTPAGKYTIISQ